MKKTLLGAAAAFAIAAPVSAHADVVGHFDLSYQAANINWSGPGDSDVNAWTLGGAMIMPLHDGWNVQFDANHENYNWDGGDYDSAVSNVTLHGVYRTDSYGIGAYAGFGSIYSQTLYMIGGEGQYYLPNATIGGAISYGATSDGYDYNAWDARINGAYFFTPDLDVNGTVSYTSWDDYDTSVTGIGIGGEYRFANCPFSVGANYLHETWDYGSSDVDANVFKISLSYHFGADSLQAQSQHGASFDAAPRFVDVWTRWD